MQWLSELDEPAERKVRELLRAAREVDGRPETADVPRGGLHLLAYEGDALAGYAHLDTTGDAFGNQVAELITHPQYRRHGIGTALTRELLSRVPEKLRIWSHGDHPAAARIAEREHLARARELLIMQTPARDDWPEPVLPPGVTLRTFVPGQDEQAVIEVNARAFDWHPEQGQFTVDDLRAAEAESWFDPAGFFLAERDGRVIGFHWTKVHRTNPLFDGEEVGEVYVVGVDPQAQGGGLGKALTLAGLRYLRDQGLKRIILYVEADNAPAIAVYSRLGFTRFESDVQYGR